MSKLLVMREWNGVSLFTSSPSQPVPASEDPLKTPSHSKGHRQGDKGKGLCVSPPSQGYPSPPLPSLSEPASQKWGACSCGEAMHKDWPAKDKTLDLCMHVLRLLFEEFEWYWSYRYFPEGFLSLVAEIYLVRMNTLTYVLQKLRMFTVSWIQ